MTGEPMDAIKSPTVAPMTPTGYHKNSKPGTRRPAPVWTGEL